MTTFRRLFVLSLLTGAASFARADETSAARPAPRTPSPILAILDADQNGSLSAAEIAAAPTALAGLDRDGDGAISVAEWRAAEARGRVARDSRVVVTSNLVLTLDANHDGDIQAMEIANAVSSLKRLDANHDGELSRTELRPVLVARS